MRSTVGATVLALVAPPAQPGRSENLCAKVKDSVARWMFGYQRIGWPIELDA